MQFIYAFYFSLFLFYIKYPRSEIHFSVTYMILVSEEFKWFFWSIKSSLCNLELRSDFLVGSFGTYVMLPFPHHRVEMITINFNMTIGFLFLNSYFSIFWCDFFLNSYYFISSHDPKIRIYKSCSQFVVSQLLYIVKLWTSHQPTFVVHVYIVSTCTCCIIILVYREECNN